MNRNQFRAQIWFEQRSFEIVKKYIDEMDYMGLLSSGCPVDEFDIESRRISTLLRDDCSTREIAEIIAHTFEEYFENAEDPENYMELAGKIKNAMRSLR